MLTGSTVRIICIIIKCLITCCILYIDGGITLRLTYSGNNQFIFLSVFYIGSTSTISSRFTPSTTQGSILGSEKLAELRVMVASKVYVYPPFRTSSEASPVAIIRAV